MLSRMKAVASCREGRLALVPQTSHSSRNPARCTLTGPMTKARPIRETAIVPAVPNTMSETSYNTLSSPSRIAGRSRREQICG